MAGWSSYRPVRNMLFNYLKDSVLKSAPVLISTVILLSVHKFISERFKLSIMTPLMQNHVLAFIIKGLYAYCLPQFLWQGHYYSVHFIHSAELCKECYSFLGLYAHWGTTTIGYIWTPSSILQQQQSPTCCSMWYQCTSPSLGWWRLQSVSYTHLTLPTKRIV